MKFDDLKLKDRIFIDANIFIYNFGGHSLECKQLLLRCAKNDLTGNTSTLILAETLHRPTPLGSSRPTGQAQIICSADPSASPSLRGRRNGLDLPDGWQASFQLTLNL